MPIERVAIVYEDERRPETTGVYCLKALRQLTHVEHFRPSQLRDIPRGHFDLVINIDDGLRYVWPDHLYPCAFWAIDTHMDFDWYLQKAPGFDWVFAAQRDGAEMLSAQAIPTEWMPLACDPDVHRQFQAEKTCDVCFIGNLVRGRRTDLLGIIQREFKNTHIDRLYFEDMARAYSASRVVFNCSVKNDINMRVFEALACGSLLLTNELSSNGQNELFRDGIHLATYRDREEMIDKIHFYLKHPDIRERIAAFGRTEALERHTYLKRMEHMLQVASTAENNRRQESPASRLSSTHRECAAIPNSPGRDASTHDKTQSRIGTPDLTYFDLPRPELLAQVPLSARRVLDVGCGAGRFGASIKARQGAHVTGIELNPRAASIAKTRLDDVVVADLDEWQVGFPSQSFDCVVCGDVLEHLRRPDVALRRIHQWLTPDGRLIASIPNVRNHTVLSSLIEGNWTYEPSGLLDQTHIRFFTRFEIERLYYRAGFEIDDCQMVLGEGHDEWVKNGRPDQVRVGRMDIVGMPPEEVEEFFVYQYLVEARRTSLSAYPLTTIVILTHNELAYTRQCVASIQDFTDEPIELVFVDNGSKDGTVEYLRSIPGARVIENSQNRGFPIAANQGMAVARGDQILLLNNDVVVTTGWLRRMLDALLTSQDVGLVGPLTNCTSGMQRIEVPYRDLDALETFAWSWWKSHQNQRMDTEVLMGFCLLMRTDVARELGTLDERFELGLYEDVDFACRARQAGYRNVIATDAFVHHFGHRTFIGAEIDADKLLQVNEQRFAEKWGTAKTERSPESSRVNR